MGHLKCSLPMILSISFSLESFVVSVSNLFQERDASLFTVRRERLFPFSHFVWECLDEGNEGPFFPLGKGAISFPSWTRLALKLFWEKFKFSFFLLCAKTNVYLTKKKVLPVAYALKTPNKNQAVFFNVTHFLDDRGRFLFRVKQGNFSISQKSQSVELIRSENVLKKILWKLIPKLLLSFYNGIVFSLEKKILWI